MQEVEIFFSDDSELSEYEAINKGYRHDVFVKIKQSIYRVFVYTLIRLQQDFETEMESSGFFAIVPNLVLVRDSNKSEIINTINRLFEQNFFSEIKETSDVKIMNLVKVQ